MISIPTRRCLATDEYGIVLSAESEEMRQHFFSVATLASFIAAQRA